ncbi:hypothetical protein [Streptomyces luteogriseus]|uniref:hypothetical protein n=1 Tax=Streptomyces luteogriseus TaxID=68233 RepID=UPI00379C0561
MSGSLTSRASRAALDYVTGRRLDLGAAPQTVQLALLTAAPPADPTIGQLNELQATGYARQNVTWGLATNAVPGQPSQIANSANILYGPFVDVNGLAYPATHCALIGTGAPDNPGNMLDANTAEIETDASGWFGLGTVTTKARSTAQFKTGTSSITATATAAGTTLLGTAVNYAAAPFATYATSAWVYTATAGLKAKIDLNFRDASGVTTAYKVVGQTTLAANTWTQLTHVTTVPANTATVQMLLAGDATAAGQVFFWDTMSLAQTLTQDVLMTWAFDTPGQAAQNESLQISAGALTMSLG